MKSIEPEVPRTNFQTAARVDWPLRPPHMKLRQLRMNLTYTCFSMRFLFVKNFYRLCEVPAKGLRKEVVFQKRGVQVWVRARFISTQQVRAVPGQAPPCCCSQLLLACVLSSRIRFK